MLIKLILVVLLFLLVFVVGIGTLVRAFLGFFLGSRPTDHHPGARPSSRNSQIKAERMLACSVCGVHVPESEGITMAGKFFCCEAHCK
ncbi:MAG: hypothetical protein FWF12_08610 [Betaproteobacteria bacterium]|nr:hypothetical protein [Betaproteobacteria bacterium]